MKSLEIRIVQYCNQLGSGFIDVPLRFVSSIRFLLFFWILLVIVALARNPEIVRHFIAAVLVVSALHFGITEGIFKHLSKKLFRPRKRPYVAYPEIIKPIGHKFSDSSFPSSHMASTVGMLFVSVAFYPSLLLPAILFALVMSFARLHNGMHYPSDVIAGIILGFVYGYIAMYLI